MTGDGAILAALRPLGRPDKAAQMAAYHKTDRQILGVANPEINDIVAAFRERHPMQDWLPEARALWSSGVFEARIAAAKLLTKARIPDPALEAEFWETIAAWPPDFDAWAIADHAANAGERRITADLTRLDQLEPWTTAPSLWVRRAALTFTLPLAKLRHPTDAETAARTRVLTWIDTLAHDREWFIQKAIGWWLRTLAPRDPDTVRAILATHGQTFRAIARREAERGLPKD